ncbi:MAG: heme-binding protein [Geminicoccaceae bacterium]
MSIDSRRAALVAATLGLGALATAPVAAASDSDGHRGCPVPYGRFVAKVRSVTPTVPGGLGQPMWVVLVNRDGDVCAVAFSGATRNSQWLLSRQIAAAKAFTANGLSTSRSQSFTTAALYAAVQPGGPLFGLDAGNPVDTSVAYKGPQRDWGTAEDPMVGHIVGGTITFGGGDPLFVGNAVVGGIGVSGDTADRDQAVADAIRQALGLN